MVKLLMQFPNFIGSKIYDGTKHEVDAIDCVRYSSTNIYIVEYQDHKLNKRSRALFNRGNKNITHIPLRDKTGLNKMFETWKNAKQTVTVDELFANDRDIGVSELYENLDTFKADLRERYGLTHSKTLDEFTKELEDGHRRVEAFEPVQKKYVQKDIFDSIGEALDKVPETNNESDNYDYYMGRRVDYSKKGPMDLPESSLWYMEGNAPYGIRNVDDPEPGHRPHPGFRPRPDHGPHPEGGPTPEGGPGRRK